MNKEIKEILDYISSRTVDDILLTDYFERIEDYITNLQEEIDRLKELEEEHQRINGELREQISRSLEFIEKKLLPSHSIENTDWEFEEVIWSDLPVERIKPLVDKLQGTDK